jgi:uncharacterized protein DUF4386
MERIADASPRFMARMVGVCYFILLASGFDLQYVFGKLVVATDAAATATRITSHQGLFLAGFAVALLGVASYLVVTALLYRLYEPVNRTLSLCAALFSLTGCVIQAVALIFHVMPLLVLGNQPYLSAFTLDQRQALALVLLNSYGKAYNISLVFFAFYLLQIGYLTFRSAFLPRWLGVIVALGVGWLAFLYPPLARALWPYVILSSLGEILLVMWFLVKGVDEQRWHEQAAAAGLCAYRQSASRSGAGGS